VLPIDVLRTVVNTHPGKYIYTGYLRDDGEPTWIPLKLWNSPRLVRLGSRLCQLPNQMVFAELQVLQAVSFWNLAWDPYMVRK
jgi:hypothetical protein